MTLMELLCTRVPRHVGTVFFAYALEGVEPRRIMRFTYRELYVTMRIILNEPY